MTNLLRIFRCFKVSLLHARKVETLPPSSYTRRWKKRRGRGAGRRLHAPCSTNSGGSLRNHYNKCCHRVSTSCSQPPSSSPTRPPSRRCSTVQLNCVCVLCSRWKGPEKLRIRKQWLWTRRIRNVMRRHGTVLRVGEEACAHRNIRRWEKRLLQIPFIEPGTNAISIYYST